MLVSTFSLAYVAGIAVAFALGLQLPTPIRPLASAALIMPWLFLDEGGDRGPSRLVPGPTEIRTDPPWDNVRYGHGDLLTAPEIPTAFWKGMLEYGKSVERHDFENAHLYSAPTRTQPSSWTALGLRANDIRLSHSHETDLLWAKLNAKTVLIDPNAVPNVPVRRSGWQTEESLRLPFFGSFFVVGQVGANSTSVEWQQYKFTGKTGLGWKLPSWLGGEVQVRSGRSVSNYDSDTETLVPEQMKRFVELATRWPVADWLNLEYTGLATANLSPTAREILTHEVRVAVPLSRAGEFHIGARYRAEDTPQSFWYERTKLLIGLEMRR